MQTTSFAPILEREECAKKSDVYVFLSTHDVINIMRKNGYDVVRVMQRRAKWPERRYASKHIVIFQSVMARTHHDDLGGIVPQIVFVNSHDGTTAWSMHIGLFRYVCSNGLIVSDASFGSFKIAHKYIDPMYVRDVAEIIATRGRDVVQRLHDYQSIMLSRDARLEFAHAAYESRYRYRPRKPVFNVEQLLIPRRVEDTTPTLWNTYNVVQENLFKGGIRTESKRGTRTLRAIANVDDYVRVNTELWSLLDVFQQRYG